MAWIMQRLVYAYAYVRRHSVFPTVQPNWARQCRKPLRLIICARSCGTVEKVRSLTETYQTHCRRRGWIIGETIALAEQALLTRIQRAPNHRNLRNQTTRPLRRNHNAYWKALAKETDRAVACGDTKKLYQMLKSVSHRPTEVGEVLIARDGIVSPDQARRLRRWGGTSENSSIMPHQRTPPSHQHISPQQNSTHVKLTRHPWRRRARLSGSCKTIKLLERTASQRRFTRRALTPGARGCTWLSAKSNMAA